MSKKFTVTEYSFDQNLESKIVENHRDYLSWPIVYLLKDQITKEAYVGETTDVLTRLKTHSKTEKKKHLSSVNLILSNLFNKSAALDLEANLIRYLSGDAQYGLQNANLGISNHKFYQQKEVYWDLFKDIWDELRQMGISKHSLDYIDNSDLFKYSPYKSLSREQVSGLKMILNCLLDNESKVSLVHGGAGTGKSILAIFVFKLLKTNLSDFNFADFDEEDKELFELLKKVKAKFGELNMALVIPMASFRKTISNVFKNIKGLSSNMVIGPSELSKRKYDLLIVDEGHRLRRRVNLGSYFGTFDKNSELLGLDKFINSELDWVVMQGKKSIIFYDEYQSIKPSDALKEQFVALQSQSWTRKERLKTQFRVRGGNKYVDFIHKLFSDQKITKATEFASQDYEFYLYNDLDSMVNQIKKKEESDGLSRMVAGFAWEWVSNKDKSLFDIVIGSTHLKWNSIAVDWVNSKNSMSEVGCIHTTQGYDLNFTGVIIGPELDYDFEKNELVVYKERYKDKNGKNSIKNSGDLKGYILNIYKTILLRGIQGTYIYACNENLRRYLATFIPIKDALKAERKLLVLEYETEKTVPFYNLEIAAGLFSELQTMSNIRYVEVEEPATNLDDYFTCRVVGESMNKIIPNGSICLFRKYFGGSRNGLITLVESSNIQDYDLGSNYTVKEYSSKKTTSEEGWKHEEITLLPRSNVSSYSPIVLRDEELSDLRVIGTFVRVLSAD
jgi:DUF2075 family protein/predicted GIY-YIG superfamily endonuclease